MSAGGFFFLGGHGGTTSASRSVEAEVSDVHFTQGTDVSSSSRSQHITFDFEIIAKVSHVHQQVVSTLWTPHLPVRTHAHIFLVHITCVTDVSLTFGSRLSSVARFSKVCHLSIMSLLDVLVVSHFPMVTSSPTCSLSRPSASIG